jgi:hypothetical protein
MTDRERETKCLHMIAKSAKVTYDWQRERTKVPTYDSQISKGHVWLTEREPKCLHMIDKSAKVTYDWQRERTKVPTYDIQISKGHLWLTERENQSAYIWWPNQLRSPMTDRERETKCLHMIAKSAKVTYDWRRERTKVPTYDSQISLGHLWLTEREDQSAYIW